MQDAPALIVQIFIPASLRRGTLARIMGKLMIGDDFLAFRIRLLSCLLCLLTAVSAPAWADNPFGVMLWPNGEDPSVFLARARGLGVAWLRPPAVFVDRWQAGATGAAGAPCPVCAMYARSDLKLALTVRNGGRDTGTRQPSLPPTDLAAYRTALASVLDAWKPAMLVIENEENTPGLYADPSADFAGYARELAAACAVSHQRGIPCANGGMTEETAAALTWMDFIDNQQPDLACDFAKRTFTAEISTALCASPDHKSLPAPLKASLIAPAMALLNIYRAAPIDAVNFHWFGADARAFAEVIMALGHITGKPAMSNEIGQRSAADPNDVRPLLRAAIAAHIKVAIWYSIDTSNTRSLFEPDGRLRPAGWEFQRQMSGFK